MASVALPHLYTNPFHILYFTEKDTQDYLPSIVNLIYTLVSHCIEKDPSCALSGVLYTMFHELSHQLPTIQDNVDSASTVDCNYNNSNSNIQHQISVSTKKSPLDYLSYIRHLDLCSPFTYSRPLQITHQTFLHSIGFDNIPYQHLNQFDPRLLCDQPLGSLDIRSLWVALLREANWFLATSNINKNEDKYEEKTLFGRIKSLTIPVSDIARYLGIIEQLKILENIQFCLDWVKENTPMDIERVLWEKKVYEHQKVAMQSLVDLVREHARLFPGELKIVTCPDINYNEFEQGWDGQEMLHSLPQSCSEALIEYWRLLPTLKGLRVLDETNWLGVLMHIKKTDLSNVVCIRMEAMPGSVIHNALCKQYGLLKHCRALKILETWVLGEGTYKWAVNEKKALLKRVMMPSISTIKGIQDSGSMSKDRQNEGNSDDQSFVQNGLLSLEKVLITDYDTCDTLKSTDEVNDIAFAFSETLTHLIIKADHPRFQWYSTYDKASLDRVRIGQGWVILPNLRVLSISVKSVRLIISGGLLSHCPNLVRMNLCDMTTLFQTWSAVDCYCCDAAKLRHVKEIVLIGWSALTFNPGTLSSVGGNLKELLLRVSYSNSDQFVQSSQLPLDLLQSTNNNRENKKNQLQYYEQDWWHHWTWDWYLPNLTHLELDSYFAFLFRFQMLKDCHAMVSLSLNMLVGVNHVREIDRSVLYEHEPRPLSSTSIPKSDDFLGTGKVGPRKQIVLPALTKLQLWGEWTIVGEDTFLEEFLVSMFPNLEHLVAKYWLSCSVSKFISIMRKSWAAQEDRNPGSALQASNDQKQQHQQQQQQRQKTQILYYLRKIELGGDALLDTIEEIEEELAEAVIEETLLEWSSNISNGIEIDLGRNRIHILK